MSASVPTSEDIVLSSELLASDVKLPPLADTDKLQIRCSDTGAKVEKKF